VVKLAHHPELFDSLRVATREEPPRILMSACLVGLPCGVEGSDYGLGKTMAEIVALPTAHIVPFCPEHHGIGARRTMPNIHGGDGFDVLDGHARVLDEHGADLTEAC